MISLPDTINGIFESGGGILCWMNAYRLYQDKIIRGVYAPVQGFFFVWGLWNLFYYPSLNQWCSFWGGVLLAAGNGAWIFLAVKYRLQK